MKTRNKQNNEIIIDVKFEIKIEEVRLRSKEVNIILKQVPKIDQIAERSSGWTLK